MTTKFCSDFLYVRPTFLNGIGSVLNIGGEYYSYNFSPSPSEADARALANDWKMIGSDFRRAFEMILR
jgi:hypothetical protein